MLEAAAGNIDQETHQEGGQTRSVCCKGHFVSGFNLSLDATAEETLFLTTEVSCASPPHMRVATCSSCQSREVNIPNLTTLDSNIQLNRPSGLRGRSQLESDHRPQTRILRVHLYQRRRILASVSFSLIAQRTSIFPEER